MIAALLIELESDAEGHPVSPSQHDIDNLYVTCSALALQADESQQSEFSGSDVLQTSQIDETISSWTTPDYNHEQPLGSKSGSSGFSISSQHSPLEFLQAALPDVPTPRLRHALLYAENEDVDLWDIIAGILTDESNLEIDERGHDGLEDVLFLGGIDFEWQPAESEKKPSTKERKKKIRPRSNKFALSDIRQQHHTRPSSKRGSIIKQSTTSDPWTQISSLSTHVASLLPPHPPSFFQSFFHSPNHATSYDALRAALTSLCKQDADNYIATVSYLMDIILPDIGGVDPELDARITADIQLSVAVADGRANDALDLVNLLRDLDTRPEMGLSHLLPTQASNSGGDARPSGARLPYSSGPLLVSSSKVKSKIRPPSTPSEDKLSTYQWHVIPQRKIVADNSSPHAYHIDECKRRLAEATLKRSELLQEAKRMSKTHGGGAAQHYAERVCSVLSFSLWIITTPMSSYSQMNILHLRKRRR